MGLDLHVPLGLLSLGVFGPQLGSVARVAPWAEALSVPPCWAVPPCSRDRLWDFKSNLEARGGRTGSGWSLWPALRRVWVSPFLLLPSLSCDPLVSAPLLPSHCSPTSVGNHTTAVLRSAYHPTVFTEWTLLKLSPLMFISDLLKRPCPCHMSSCMRLGANPTQSFSLSHSQDHSVSPC